jgi:Leucine-rich repeat (LRR) protein
MKLSAQTLILNLHRDPISGITLDLSSKNLTTLLPLLSLLPNASHVTSSYSSSLPTMEEIRIFIGRYNYLKLIEDVFDYFGNLRFLDLSINHITDIGNLKTLIHLEHLNLSQNRISKIEGIANLLKISHLVVIMLNYIHFFVLI